MVLKKIAFTLLSAFILCACSAKESRIQRIQSQNPNWDQATVKKLADWQIEIGMTSGMVQAALGKPDSVSSEGGEEVWGFAMWVVTYARHYKRFVYFVYFKDNKVIKTEGDVERLRQLL